MGIPAVDVPLVPVEAAVTEGVGTLIAESEEPPVFGAHSMHDCIGASVVNQVKATASTEELLYEANVGGIRQEMIISLRHNHEWRIGRRLHAHRPHGALAVLPPTQLHTFAPELNAVFFDFLG